MLVISSVETDDSGTYVCTVTTGSFQVFISSPTQKPPAETFQVQESLELDVSEDPSQGGRDPYGNPYGRESDPYRGANPYQPSEDTYGQPARAPMNPYQQEPQLTISPPYTEVVAGEEAVFECEGAVSYKHLTLPTNREV